MTHVNDTDGQRNNFAIQFKPNRADVEAFLSALDPTTDKFTWQTFDDDEDRKSGKLVDIKHGSLAEHWDWLCEMNAAGAGIFICVNATNLKGRTAADVERIRALFVDFDDGFPEAFHVSPHIIVRSSPRGGHAYWLVSDCALDQFRSLQSRLIAHYGSDPKLKDKSRVLRVPGLYHRKGAPYRSELLLASDRAPLTVKEASVGLSEALKPKSLNGGSNLGVNIEAEAKKVQSGLDALPTDEEKLTAKRFTRKDGTIIDAHEVFIDVGRALHRTEWGELAFELWRAWCERSKKYNLDGLRMQWRSFENTKDSEKKVTLRTIYFYARAFGWKYEESAPHAALDDFRAYMPAHAYIYLPTRELWPASSVNAKIPPVKILDVNGQPKLDDDGEEQFMKASTWLDQNRAVEQMTWAPGEPELITDRVVDQGGWIDKPGVTIFNLYRPPTIAGGRAAEALPWVEHVRRVYPDDADHIIRYFAHRTQRPQEKVNHGLVMGGAPGIGKDTLLEPVKRAVGPWNVSEVSPQQVLGRFNSFVKSVILRMSEARDLGELNRFALYEHMKAYLAAPPDVLRCDEKNLREHAVFNVMGVVITSNRKDSFYLPADDRRHYVAWTEVMPGDFDEGYWRDLWGWYENGGYAHVAAYLAAHDISDFNPKAPPPKTPAFWEIVEINRSPEDSEMADAIDRLGKDDGNGGVVTPDALTIDMVKKAAPLELDDWLRDRRNARQIPHRLSACGYVAIRNEGAKDGCWKLGGRRQMVYAKAELSVRDQCRVVSELVSKG
jgi:Primase C terminal 2 (PriCT-2)/RepB DNA-primase N-terminal domain/Family of unknown function (DUF5906)